MNAQSKGTELTGTIAPDALSSMFQAIAGLRNLRAAAAMLGCFLAAWIVVALGAAVGRGSVGVGVLGSLVALIVGFSGIHASGVLLMDQARGVPGRSIRDAVVYGVMCVPKTIVLIIALVVVAIGVYLAIALLFFVSKIPGIGPVLFAVTFPLAVVLAGATFTALFVGVFLSLAAIWQGATIGGALVQTLTILRHRLVETVLLSIVVSVLAGIVGGVVGFILLTGFWPATGMALQVLGVSVGDLGGLSSMLFGQPSFGRGGLGAGGYAIAGLFGAGVLWAIAMTLLMQVGLLGINLVYLRVSEGLDSSATKGALQTRLAEARRKAAEVGQKARDAADRARANAEEAAAKRRAEASAAAAAAASAAPEATPVAAAPPAVAATTAATCPACNASVAPSDVFCGECGQELA